MQPDEACTTRQRVRITSSCLLGARTPSSEPVETMSLDLASLAGVRRFALAVLQTLGAAHISVGVGCPVR